MFLVVTDSQFELPQFFISQIDRGSIALSLRWVLVKRGVGIGASAIFFLKNAVLGLGLRLVISLTLTLTLKQHSLKKRDRPRPRPGTDPAFYWHPKIDGRDNIDLEGNFEKIKK